MKCKICDNTENNKTYEVREMQFGFRDKFAYFQCAKCSCLQITDIPANISKYYPSNYYSFNIPVWEPKEDNILVKTVKRIRNEYAITKKGLIGKFLYSKYPAKGFETESHFYFPDHPPKNLYSKDSRILDVGCGNGSFLHVLKEVGFKNLLGIDPYCENDIARKMEAIVEDGQLRKNLVEKGIARSKEFSWEKTAEEMLALYQIIA